MNNDFTSLVPDLFLPALEEALGKRLTSLIRPFPSYINRVYEVQTEEKETFVAKFYRPGRWKHEAVLDEHTFMFDCADAEIPVVCPLMLANQSSLMEMEGIAFAVFPKKAGRRFDIEGDESWQRIGALLGRLHMVGAKRRASSRLVLSPSENTQKYVELLLEDAVPREKKQSFKDACIRILELIKPLFEGQEIIRLHGDFHSGNILERPDTGLLIIDFDDMMNGPAAQDFWLLLPDHYPACRQQLEQLLAGYGLFREADIRCARLIEALRAMRLIYFTAWCMMQREDAQFQSRFPDWGSDTFWTKEISDLRQQYHNIQDALDI